MTRRAITEGDVPRLTALWLRCFSDTEEAVQLFFERNLLNIHGYLAEEDGALIAAVYLVGCTLCGKPAHYLCGAATAQEHRGRGVMTSLIGFALQDAARRGDAYSVLLPADEGLYRFYGRLGYTAVGAVCRRELDTDGVSAAEPPAGEPRFEALQRRCHHDKFLLWNKEYIRFARDYYACYGAEVGESERLFALYEREGDRAEVFYAVYDSIEELKATLRARGVRRFALTGCAENPLFGGCTPQVCGMAKALQPNAPLPGRVYIGLTLS